MSEAKSREKKGRIFLYLLCLKCCSIHKPPGLVEVIEYERTLYGITTIHLIAVNIEPWAWRSWWFSGQLCRTWRHKGIACSANARSGSLSSIGARLAKPRRQNAAALIACLRFVVDESKNLRLAVTRTWVSDTEFKFAVCFTTPHQSTTPAAIH